MYITIVTNINAPIEAVWSSWTTPEDITKWNFASDDWSCPSAKLDLKPGGKFSYRMEAKDGSAGFDFGGTFDILKDLEKIEYVIADGRKVSIEFSSTEGGTKVVETFEAEGTHPPEFQKHGWQSILDNFKKHVESKT